MKREWSGMNGLADLGLSRSTLNTLESVERALDSVGGIGAAARAAARAAETWRAGASLSGLMDGARVEGLADMGARGALSAISAAETNSNVALGKSNASLASSLLKDAASIGVSPLPSSAQGLALGKASHAYPALDALSGLAKGASSLNSAGKVSSLAAAIPKSAALGIPLTMLGAGDGLSAARSAVSFLGSRNQASDLFASARRDSLLSGLPQGVLSGAYSGLQGLLGADAARNVGAWRDVMSLSETSWLFGLPRGLGASGAQTSYVVPCPPSTPSTPSAGPLA